MLKPTVKPSKIINYFLSDKNKNNFCVCTVYEKSKVRMIEYTKYNFQRNFFNVL